MQTIGGLCPAAVLESQFFCLAMLHSTHGPAAQRPSSPAVAATAESQAPHIMYFVFSMHC